MAETLKNSATKTLMRDFEGGNWNHLGNMFNMKVVKKSQYDKTGSEIFGRILLYLQNI